MELEHRRRQGFVGCETRGGRCFCSANKSAQRLTDDTSVRRKHGDWILLQRIRPHHQVSNVSKKPQQNKRPKKDKETYHSLHSMCCRLHLLNELERGANILFNLSNSESHSLPCDDLNDLRNQWQARLNSVQVRCCPNSISVSNFLHSQPLRVANRKALFICAVGGSPQSAPKRPNWLHKLGFNPGQNPKEIGSEKSTQIGVHYKF